MGTLVAAACGLLLAVGSEEDYVARLRGGLRSSARQRSRWVVRPPHHHRHHHANASRCQTQQTDCDEPRREDLLVLLFHGSAPHRSRALGWPDRVEAALAALVAVEASPRAFDALAVVLETDSPGRREHNFRRCDAYRDWAILPREYRGAGWASCDVVALLERGGVPSVVVGSGREAANATAAAAVGRRSVVVAGPGVLASASAVQSIADAAESSGEPASALGPRSRLVLALDPPARAYATHVVNFARTHRIARAAHRMTPGAGGDAECGPLVAAPASSFSRLSVFRYGSFFLGGANPLCGAKTPRLHLGAYAFQAETPTDFSNAAPSWPVEALSSSSPSSTLLALTCAGVWRRTLTALLSLEGHRRSAFDLVVAVTPRLGDATANVVRAAGVPVLEQPAAFGLTDLWNRVVRYALDRRYAVVVIANNDVLVSDGAVAALASTVLARDQHPYRLASAVTNEGGASHYFFPREAKPFVGHPLNWGRVDSRRQNRAPFVAIPGFTAFFFALDLEWAVQALALHEPEPRRLWNSTRWMNYGQEEDMLRRGRVRRVAHVLDAFVFHFRGATLPASECQNGRKDCASWQLNHRRDHKPPFLVPPPSIRRRRRRRQRIRRRRRRRR